MLALAEDHVNPNLLFAGTEFGLWFTIDGGKKWVQLKGNMPTIAVHEVTTFYNMYNQHRVGKYKLNVCTNLPCQLRDGQKALHHLEQRLGIQMGETTADGLFTLQQSECLGACADSPVMLVNDRTMCSFMSNDKLDQLIEGLKGAQG